jgi:hypothetical protein
MTMDQAEFTWDATPYADAAPTRSGSRRTAWRGPTVAVVRAVAFLLIATLAILVLLPAAIAAQTAYAI